MQQDIALFLAHAQTILPHTSLEAAVAISHIVLAGILTRVAQVDKRTLHIPNAYVLGIIGLWAARLLVGIAICFFDPSFEESLCAWISTAIDGLSSAFLTGGGLLAFSTAFSAATGRPSIGGGDIKLIFAIGLFLDVKRSALNLLLSCVVVLALSPLLARRESDSNADTAAEAVSPIIPTPPHSSASSSTSENAPSNHAHPQEQASNRLREIVPFGPALCIATVLTLLV